MTRPHLPALLAFAVVSLPAVAQENPQDMTSYPSAQLQNVRVVNLPSSWDVRGEVSVTGPIRQGSMVVIKDILVPPVAKGETTRLVNAGTITADGFTAMVVGVAGQIKDQRARAGQIGAFLVPDDELMLRALDEQGQLLFATEVKAGIGGGVPPYFASDQPRTVVAFPRYRVLLYNTSDRSATVNVYAYLSN